MKIKIIVLVIAIIGILALSLFGFNIKETALRGMVQEVPEYNCGDDNLCTSCMIEGDMCSCGQYTCDCGNKTIDKKECSL